MRKSLIKVFHVRFCKISQTFWQVKSIGSLDLFLSDKFHTNQLISFQATCYLSFTGLRKNYSEPSCSSLNKNFIRIFVCCISEFVFNYGKIVLVYPSENAQLNTFNSASLPVHRLQNRLYLLLGNCPSNKMNQVDEKADF